VSNGGKYLIDFWLFVWEINYLDALKIRTNLCTNPTYTIKWKYDWRMTNWKWFGWTQSWSNRGTIPAFP
jgi:hypothetical protein